MLAFSYQFWKIYTYNTSESYRNIRKCKTWVHGWRDIYKKNPSLKSWGFRKYLISQYYLLARFLPFLNHFLVIYFFFWVEGEGFVINPNCIFKTLQRSRMFTSWLCSKQLSFLFLHLPCLKFQLKLMKNICLFWKDFLDSLHNWMSHRRVSIVGS